MVLLSSLSNLTVPSECFFTNFTCEFTLLLVSLCCIRRLSEFGVKVTPTNSTPTCLNHCFVCQLSLAPYFFRLSTKPGYAGISMAIPTLKIITVHQLPILPVFWLPKISILLNSSFQFYSFTLSKALFNSFLHPCSKLLTSV
jgi:hypothetical protein